MKFLCVFSILSSVVSLLPIIKYIFFAFLLVISPVIMGGGGAVDHKMLRQGNQVT